MAYQKLKKGCAAAVLVVVGGCVAGTALLCLGTFTIGTVINSRPAYLDRS